MCYGCNDCGRCKELNKQIVKCPKCGARNIREKKVCKRCGTKLVSDS